MERKFPESLKKIGQLATETYERMKKMDMSLVSDVFNIEESSSFREIKRTLEGITIECLGIRKDWIQAVWEKKSIQELLLFQNDSVTIGLFVLPKKS